MSDLQSDKITNQQTKLDTQRDTIDDQNTELQRLQDEISELKKSDILNFQQHKEILDLLRPIADTYKTVNVLGKWMMALLLFLSILGGVIWTWGNIFRK